MVSSESIYNLLLGSSGWVTEEEKFEFTKGIYVDVDSEFSRANLVFVNRIKGLLTSSS